MTHSWQNLFRDLVAAVIADAVNEPAFELVAHLLDETIDIVEDLLRSQGSQTFKGSFLGIGVWCEPFCQPSFLKHVVL